MSPSDVLSSTDGCAACEPDWAKAGAFAIRAALPSANINHFMKILGVGKTWCLEWVPRMLRKRAMPIARRRYRDGAIYGGIASEPFAPPNWKLGVCVMFAVARSV